MKLSDGLQVELGLPLFIQVLKHPFKLCFKHSPVSKHNPIHFELNKHVHSPVLCEPLLHMQQCIEDFGLVVQEHSCMSDGIDLIGSKEVVKLLV